MGWIVLLQVGLPALDRVRCDVALPPARWVAICLILVLQAYLVLAPAVPKSGAAKPPKCLSGLLVRTRYTGYTYSVCRSNKGCWPSSSRGPMYGYQLRAEFESRTGATWPLNVGQVYTTLARLERDGLVEAAGSDDGGHVFYGVTNRGRAEVATWFATPVSRSAPPRDELAIKLAMAVTVPGVDVRAVVQGQRTATIRALQDYTRLKARADTENPHELAWLLVLDSLVFAAEAEIRWLDHCESRLARVEANKADRAKRPSDAPVTDEKAVRR